MQKQSKLLQSIIYNSRYRLNKEARRRERGQFGKYDINNCKINGDNHPITIARVTLGIRNTRGAPGGIGAGWLACLGGFKRGERSKRFTVSCCACRKADIHRMHIRSFVQNRINYGKTNINLVCFTVNHKGGKAHLKLHSRDVSRFQDKE